MAKRVFDDSTITKIADPLRALSGRTNKMTPAEMAAAGESAADEMTEQADVIAEIRTALQGKAAGGSTDVEDGLLTRTLTEYTNGRVTTIGDGAFYGSKSLVKISLPKVTSVGGHAFYKCTSLRTLDLPLLTSAGTQAFAYLEMPEIYLPRLKTIGTYAFGYTSVPHTIHLPSLTTASNSSFRDNKGVTRVELDACSKVDTLSFYGCSKLETLILRKSDAVCTLQNVNAFNGTPIANGTGYVYVPAALVDGTMAGWSTYATQIRAIEDYPDICGEV